MLVGGYLDKILCFELIFNQIMFISASVNFVHWQLGFFLRHRGFAFLGFLLNSNYGRMAGRIWEKEKQCFFTAGKYSSNVNDFRIRMLLLLRNRKLFEK